jgi:D-alanyl-D-alanine carboxypeptidase
VRVFGFLRGQVLRRFSVFMTSLAVCCALILSPPAFAAKRGKRAAALEAAQAIALPKPPRPQLVVDVASGVVFHAQEARTLWHPASLTKLMTIYVAFQALKSDRVHFDTPLTVSILANQQKPSKMGFKPGSIVTLEAALYMIMVKSANDMSVAIAEGISGSVPAFVNEMNSWSQRLGMTDTVWRNPNGLPDNAQVTSARDLAILSRALINDFPGLQTFLNTPAIQVGDSIITNHNPLLGRLEGADGLKTGYICDSGFNIVATATRNGARHIAVVLGGDSSRARTEWAALLLEKSFLRGTKPEAANLQGLPHPASAAPVNMKPYVCTRRVKRNDMEQVSAEILAFAPSTLSGFGSTQVQGDEEVNEIRERSSGKKYASLLGPRPSAVQAVVIAIDPGNPKLQIPMRVAPLGRALPPLPPGVANAAPLPLAIPSIVQPATVVKKNSF